MKRREFIKNIALGTAAVVGSSAVKADDDVVLSTELHDPASMWYTQEYLNYPNVYFVTIWGDVLWANGGEYIPDGEYVWVDKDYKAYIDKSENHDLSCGYSLTPSSGVIAKPYPKNHLVRTAGLYNKG